MNKITPEGQRYHSFLVLKETTPKSDPNGRKRRHFLCLCDCGTEFSTALTSIRSNLVTSCGCVRKIKFRNMITKHNLIAKYPKEYIVWRGMRSRCRKNPNYHDRGIKVCERWDHFDLFIQDMGQRPDDNLTIERVNNELGYDPTNCIWATRKEQNNNRRPRRSLKKPLA